MPVVVDYNLCDSAEGCQAVSICDAEALYFDKTTGRVEYNIEKCRNCGTCAHYCAPGAVMHVPTKEEWLELKSLLQEGSAS